MNPASSLQRALLTVPVLAALACSNAADPTRIVRSQIQGGTEDTSDPAVVAILIGTSNSMAVCTGSLIAPNLVLTAHHCVADSPTMTCGQTNFGATYAPDSFVVTTSYDAAATIFNNPNILTIPHPDDSTWFGVTSVAVAGANACGQDMAVLILSSPITGICPLVPAVDTDVTDGESYTAVGFGTTDPDAQLAGTRYKVGGLSVQCAEDCNYPSQIGALEWLGASNGDAGTCEGDSGGPAIDSLGRVIGSVSRGPQSDCTSTVYESTFSQASWIKSMATQAASAGGYAPAGWVTGGTTTNIANSYCASGSDSGTATNDVGASVTDSATSIDAEDAGSHAATSKHGCSCNVPGGGSSGSNLAVVLIFGGLAGLNGLRRRRRPSEHHRSS